MADTQHASSSDFASTRTGKGLARSLRHWLQNIDSEIFVRKIMWNMVLLFLGLFIGFVVIQHAMFYSLPPNLDEFLYVQKEVYIVFSVMFVLSIRTLFFLECKIRSLSVPK